MESNLEKQIEKLKLEIDIIETETEKLMKKIPELELIRTEKEEFHSYRRKKIEILQEIIRNNSNLYKKKLIEYYLQIYNNIFNKEKKVIIEKKIEILKKIDENLQEKNFFLNFIIKIIKKKEEKIKKDLEEPKKNYNNQKSKIKYQKTKLENKLKELNKLLNKREAIQKEGEKNN